MIPSYLQSDPLAWRLICAGKSIVDALAICERAAILQYDAGIDREGAERLAETLSAAVIQS